MSLEMSNAKGKASAGKQGCAIHKLLLPHRCSLMIHVKLMRDFSPAPGRFENFFPRAIVTCRVTCC